MNREKATTAIAAFDAHKAGATRQEIAKILAPAGLRITAPFTADELHVTDRPTLVECVRAAFVRRFA